MSDGAPVSGLLHALAGQGWQPDEGVLDPEVAYLADIERAMSADPDGYRSVILAAAADRLSSEVSMHAMQECVATIAAAEVPAYRSAEALQICVRDLELLERLDSIGFPPADVATMRNGLAPAAIELTRRIWGNLVTRLVPARVEARGDLASVRPLADTVPSSPPVTLAAPDGPALVMLTAGRGTRLRTTIPKGLVPLGGRILADHVIAAATAAGIEQRVFALKYRARQHLAHLSAKGACLILDRADGTGHSAFLALDALRHHRGPVLLCYSDTPFLGAAPIERALSELCARRAALTVSTFAAPEPALLGQVRRGTDGAIVAIAQPRLDMQEPHAHRSGTVDGGLYATDPAILRAVLGGLRNDNPRREYSFTDVVASLARHGAIVAEAAGSAAEFQSINSPSDLSAAELRAAHATAGSRLHEAVRAQVGPLLGLPELAGGAA